MHGCSWENTNGSTRLSWCFSFCSAALMKNSGSLFANDANADRAKAIVSNLFRLGVHNAVVSCYDARMFPKVFVSVWWWILRKSRAKRCGHCVKNLVFVCLFIGVFFNCLVWLFFLKLFLRSWEEEWEWEVLLVSMTLSKIHTCSHFLWWRYFL